MESIIHTYISLDITTGVAAAGCPLVGEKKRRNFYVLDIDSKSSYFSAFSKKNGTRSSLGQSAKSEECQLANRGCQLVIQKWRFCQFNKRRLLITKGGFHLPTMKISIHHLKWSTQQVIIQ